MTTFPLDPQDPDPRDARDVPGTRPPRALRLRTEADVLAFVPYSLGFHPHDSLVVIGVGAHGRPMTGRADLSGDADEARECARTLADAVSVNGSVLAVVVAYTDDPLWAALSAESLLEELADRHVPVAHVFRADGTHWFPLLPGDAGWSDATAGEPYDLDVHALTAESVAEGRVTYADREELAASLDPASPELVEAVADALDGLAALTGRGALRAEAQWAAAWVRHRVGHPVEVPRWPTAEDTARLLRVLAVPAARDVVLAEVTLPTARAQVPLWRALARLAPDGHRGPVSAMLAFAAWLDGDGALAWCAVDRARAADPEIGLATVVAGVLENALPPTTWQPVDPASLPLLSA
jgi:hypothetical protein